MTTWETSEGSPGLWVPVPVRARARHAIAQRVALPRYFFPEAAADGLEPLVT
jgi:hypothetical protein